MLACPFPTRFVVRASKRVLSQAPKNYFLKIADISAGSFKLIPPDFFRLPCYDPVTRDDPFVLFLAANKESLARDPIVFSRLSEKLRVWASECKVELTISRSTDALFRERRGPLGGREVPRPFPLGRISLVRFFNAIEHEEMHPVGQFHDTFLKIDKWPRELGFLGLLPPIFRKWIKARTPEEARIPEQLSRTIFFAGYATWKRRRNLIRELLSKFPSSKASDVKNPFIISRGSAIYLQGEFVPPVSARQITSRRLTVKIFVLSCNPNRPI